MRTEKTGATRDQDTLFAPAKTRHPPPLLKIIISEHHYQSVNPHPKASK
jgi:hypothetical protein